MECPQAQILYIDSKCLHHLNIVVVSVLAHVGVYTGSNPVKVHTFNDFSPQLFLAH